MIKFFHHIRKYDITEKCFGFSFVYDGLNLSERYLFGLSLYLELIWWQVSLIVDFYKKERKA